MTFDELFSSAPVMAILRGYAPDEAVALAETIWALGVDIVEVPIQDTASLDTHLNRFFLSFLQISYKITLLDTSNDIKTFPVK